MCTRPYRLDWNSRTSDRVAVFEVEKDLSLLQAKRGALAGYEPRAKVVDVQGDVTADFGEALLAAGFDVTQPTDWIAEGLLARVS